MGKPGVGIQGDLGSRGERGYPGKVLRLDDQVVVPGDKGEQVRGVVHCGYTDWALWYTVTGHCGYIDRALWVH